jgi:hypothetical protein
MKRRRFLKGLAVAGFGAAITTSHDDVAASENVRKPDGGGLSEWLVLRGKASENL